MFASDPVPMHRGARSPGVRELLNSLRRFVIATNPFYPASALLLLVGVRLCADPSTSIDNARRLVGVLLGSIVVMAGTAALIIRLGRLWDEARVLLLTIVILFLATSMIFDEMVLVHPWEGTQFLSIALVLAIVVSEAVRWVCRIRLGVLFTVPYYLSIACFFVYPAMLAHFYQHSWQSALGWGIAGFGPACGLAFLTLLPAVRCGPGYAATPAVPWRWPWYPWTLFVALGAAVCIRASLLYESFNPVKDDLLVAHTYLAVPFLFSAAVVFFEIALIARSSIALRIAIAVPFAFLLLAFAEESTSRKGIDLVQWLTQIVGSPLYLTSRGVIVFQAYTFLRQRRASDWPLSAALLAASMIGTASTGLKDVSTFETLPLLGFAALQWFRRRYSSTSLRLFLTTVALTAIAWTEFRGTPLAFHWVRILQVVVATAIVFGSAHTDRWARVLLRSGVIAWCLLASALVIVPAWQVPGSAAWWDTLYLMQATAGSFAFALATCVRVDRNTATASSIALACDVFRATYSGLGASFLVRGRLALLGAAGCFLVAVALSVRKARSPGQALPARASGPATDCL